MINKSIKDIFWQIDEPEYRKDPALSQSTLSTFERKGFECLDTLFDHEESASLTFGSAVDAIITGGEQEFNDRFFVSDIPKLSAAVEPVVKAVYNQFHNSYTNIYDIPDDSLIKVLWSCSYKGNTNWGTKAKCDAIRKDGAQYYQTLFIAGNKTVLSQDVYNKVFACVRALKDSPQTKNYFCEDNPFENIERVYQQKFKGELNGIIYRGMADLLIVDHEHKVVYPCDLKTSHNREYNFPKSFIEFGYNIQARLYWRLIRQTMNRDEYFKDFKLEDFRFIVVNNDNNPIPVVWVFEGTQALGDIEVGPYKLRDPEKIGQELTYYLKNRPAVPMGVSLSKPNSIEKWFK